ncbi:hypothetical protein EK904_005733 [Melospiza melodia maxima]|nr:hypothetical protein EK904_005733 [Melospiza melodia maxima]
MHLTFAQNFSMLVSASARAVGCAALKRTVLYPQTQKNSFLTLLIFPLVIFLILLIFIIIILNGCSMFRTS